MKAPVSLCAAALLLFGSSTFVSAADFKSAIITPGTPLSINVPADHFIVIRNFTQEGGTDRGVVTVTLHNQATSAKVLAAAIIDSTTAPDVINSIVIAGPAAISATCGSDATACVVSYRKDSEE